MMQKLRSVMGKIRRKIIRIALGKEIFNALTDGIQQKILDFLQQDNIVINSKLDQITKFVQQELTEDVKKIRTEIRSVIDCQQEELINRIIEKRNENNLFILLVHSWYNIGDLAISISEDAFLVKHFSSYNIFSLSSLNVVFYWSLLKNIIKPADLIIIPDGGNMGDLWLREERLRRKIVDSFAGNVIISFPQSVHFQQEEELHKSIECYQRHKKLMLSARDDTSEDKLRLYFPSVKVVRTEDIVFSYEYTFFYDRLQEKQVLFVLRNDQEKRVKDGVDKQITALLPSNTSIGYTDTEGDNFAFNAGGFSAIVYNKITQMHQASLVVTDRLHGAIFSLQAGTPVIVFDNSYRKISGALKHIRQRISSDYLLFVEDIDKDITPQQIETMLNLPKLDKKMCEIFAPEFDLYAKQIKDFIEQHNKLILKIT